MRTGDDEPAPEAIRTALRDVIGFDENFPFRLGGDDVDIGVRVTQHGHMLISNPNAVVIHSRETWGPIAVLRRAFRWGRMNYHLFRKHPQQSSPALPSTSFLFGVLLLLACLAALVKSDVRLLSLPLVWLSGNWLSEVILLLRTGRKPVSVARDWLASQVELVFETGNLFESIKQLDLRPIYQSFSYQPTQGADAVVIQVGERKAIRHWSKVIGLLLTISVTAAF